MIIGWVCEFQAQSFNIIFFGIDNSFLTLISKAVDNFLVYNFLYFLNTLCFYTTILVFIHSGSRGLTVLTSLGTKLDIIFKIVPFKMSTWRLGLWFLRLNSHGNLNTAALMEFSLARSKCQNFLEYFGGGGILKLILQKTILCLTVVSSESRIPQFKTRFGWLVTIK